MKTPLASVLLALALAWPAFARPFGVSSYSAGRGTVYDTSRGGQAYVGPRGWAAQGANGREAASGRYASAYSGPNATAVSGRRYGAAWSGANGAGYVRAIPAGAQPVVYRGVNCYYVSGVYYQPVYYGGMVGYVVVP